MKRVLKGAEPIPLTQFRNASPQSTWEQMRNDPHFGGRAAYSACKSQAITDQGRLCAYCEISICEENLLTYRIEHFHPKSDINPANNWALDWNNLLGVCNGGSNPHIMEPGFYLEPTNANLSCDAHKDSMINSNKLPVSCEGYILNPLQIQATPTVFGVDFSTGKLKPNEENCKAIQDWPHNKHRSVSDLVQNTIDMLNLNCDRLNQARLSLIRSIERDIKKERAAGYTPQQVFTNLAQRYLNKRWPQFFTVIRLRLGNAAESYLEITNFQG